MPKTALGDSGLNSWNREHIWPGSCGVGTSGAAFSDLHALYPSNASANRSRGNRFFDAPELILNKKPETSTNSIDTDFFEPGDTDKGKVARACLYMAVRYDGEDYGSSDLELSNSVRCGQTVGRLDTLLSWNRLFPPTKEDQLRNQAIYVGVETAYGRLGQGNRNPFVDLPQLADLIYVHDICSTYYVWQNRHFTFAEQESPGLAGYLDDPDEDGFANLFEWLSDSDPLNRENRPLFEAAVDKNQLVMVPMRRLGTIFRNLSNSTKASAENTYLRYLPNSLPTVQIHKIILT